MPGHAVFGKERLPSRCLFVTRHTHDLYILTTAVFLLQCFEMRQFLKTWHAPCPPDVNEQQFATVFAQPMLYTLRIGKGKVGSYIAWIEPMVSLIGLLIDGTNLCLQTVGLAMRKVAVENGLRVLRVHLADETHGDICANPFLPCFRYSAVDDGEDITEDPSQRHYCSVGHLRENIFSNRIFLIGFG